MQCRVAVRIQQRYVRFRDSHGESLLFAPTGKAQSGQPEGKKRKRSRLRDLLQVKEPTDFAAGESARVDVEVGEPSIETGKQHIASVGGDAAREVINEPRSKSCRVIEIQQRRCIGACRDTYRKIR